MKDFYKNKKIFVTGAAGTVGKEIVRQLHRLPPVLLKEADRKVLNLRQPNPLFVYDLVKTASSSSGWSLGS